MYVCMYACMLYIRLITDASGGLGLGDMVDRVDADFERCDSEDSNEVRYFFLKLVCARYYLCVWWGHSANILVIDLDRMSGYDMITSVGSESQE